MKALICLITLLASDVCLAAQKLPIPRFVSTRSAEVNLRVGPGSKYPVSWKITQSGIPLEVTGEFDAWRHVRDIEGTEGWVHQSLLAGKRYGVIQNPLAPLKEKNEHESRTLAQLEQGVRPEILKCREDWCHVQVEGHKGWLRKSVLWGVYTNEQLG